MNKRPIAIFAALIVAATLFAATPVAAQPQCNVDAGPGIAANGIQTNVQVGISQQVIAGNMAIAIAPNGGEASATNTIAAAQMFEQNINSNICTVN